MRPSFQSACSTGASRNRGGRVSARLPLFPGQASRGRIAPGQVHEREPFLAQPTFVSTHCIVRVYTHARAQRTCIGCSNSTSQPRKASHLHPATCICPPAGLGPAHPDGLHSQRALLGQLHGPETIILHLWGIWASANIKHPLRQPRTPAQVRKETIPTRSRPRPPLPRQRTRNLPDRCQACGRMRAHLWIPETLPQLHKCI